jgi:hypothetical protein
MSDPKRLDEAETSILKLLYNAEYELMSASSSLCMEPEPIKHDEDRTFLADTDKWAQHSREHIVAAHRFLAKARVIAEKMRWTLMDMRLNLLHGEQDDII